MTNVLFVCIGNACRSQMAEAFANHLGQGKVRAWSAGVYPLGVVTLETHDAMEESGITLDSQRSKGLEDVPLDSMDVIVSMGCEVGCPAPPGFLGRMIEWDIPDPFGGGAARYRRVRDMIERQVRNLLRELGVHTSRKIEADPRNSKDDGA